MNYSRRIITVTAIIIAVSGLILTVDLLKSKRYIFSDEKTQERHFADGSIPLYRNNKIIGHFSNRDAAKLTMTSFKDKEENKKQEGWPLKDIISIYINDTDSLENSTVRVSSSYRNKYSTIPWQKIINNNNCILLVPSRKGTLKLAAPMTGLDSRELWVQDIDRIEILDR